MKELTMSIGSDWNKEIKQIIKNTEIRIREEKETLKLAAQLLFNDPSEFNIWFKQEVRDLLNSDEKWLQFLIKERIGLKAFYGE